MIFLIQIYQLSHI